MLMCLTPHPLAAGDAPQPKIATICIPGSIQIKHASLFLARWQCRQALAHQHASTMAGMAVHMQCFVALELVNVGTPHIKAAAKHAPPTAGRAG